MKRLRSLAERRKGQLATIHIGRQQLGMDDETYREMLRRVSAAHGAERSSAGDLDARQLDAVVRELHRLGAPARPRRHRPGNFPGRPGNFDRLPGEIAKVEALLADMKLPWAYADAIARTMFGVQRVAWLRKSDQLTALIAALHVEQKKRWLASAIDRRLKELAWTDTDLTARVTLPRNWRRNVRVLEAVAEWLDAQSPEPCRCE